MDFTKSINNIQAQRMIKEKNDLLILDVRRISEFKENRLKNAINIPVDDLEWEVDQIEEYKEKEILVYCKVGMRSSVACSILEEAGFKKLYNLRGGILDFTGEIEE